VADLSALKTSPWRRPAAIATLIVVGFITGLALLIAPQHTFLLEYFLYAIAAHLMVSFLPHETMLFAVAQAYPPVVVATVGCVASAAAIILDYWLIGWFVSRSLVRQTFDESRWYAYAQRVFIKAPFLLILGSAAGPVPFYPAKILAIANDYPLLRFIAATLIGRWPRFWLLAIGFRQVGRKVQPPNSVLTWVTIGLMALALWQIWRTRQRGRTPPIV
jgi:membrane protein YqaA with SNARE-associated domain